MGSCVSALLASLSGNKGAKRAAMIHFLFNVFGSIIIFTGLSFALTPITNFFLSISGGNLDEVLQMLIQHLRSLKYYLCSHVHL